MNNDRDQAATRAEPTCADREGETPAEPDTVVDNPQSTAQRELRPQVEIKTSRANRDDFATVVPDLAELDTRADDDTACGTMDGVFAGAIPAVVSGADTSPSQQTFSSPQRFGDYELLSEIARGGMGIVYKARQISLNRFVALKMILSGQLASEQEVQRFYAEAEAAANLEHPGIIPIFEIGQHDGQHFFTMRLIEGQSLKERLEDGPVPPREAAAMTKKIAEAVAYAHQGNVIHRDLKPANVLMDANGEPRVTDFGLAKKTDVSDGLTATGQILGTPSYMSPEQAEGRTADIGPRSDVYSIGAVLYAMLTGRPPFATDNVIDTLKQVLEHDPVPPRQFSGVIHADLETICLKCLMKSPERRYQSAIAVGDELDRFLSGRPIDAKASSVLTRAWSSMLSESRHTEVLAMWSHVWWWHAILALVLSVTTILLQWIDTSAEIITALWIPGLVAFALVVWHFRFRSGGTLTLIEKQISQVWAMFGVTSVLTGVIFHLMQLDTMQLVPVVALECGFAFCCMAVILGGSFYPIGICCFMVAVLMSLAPNFSAAIFGILIAIGLFIPALKYADGER